MEKKEKIIIPLKILMIENEGIHLLMTIKVNDKAARFIIDTGASQTVMDKNRIHRFVKEKNFEKHEALSTGLGTSDMESHIVKLKKVEFGNFRNRQKKRKLKNTSWMLLDMSHVNYSYSQIGIKEIDGVLGGDILLKFKAVISYEKKQLTFKLEE